MMQDRLAVVSPDNRRGEDKEEEEEDTVPIKSKVT